MSILRRQHFAILLGICLWSNLSVKAQTAVQFSFLAPAGKMRFVLKPAVGVELSKPFSSLKKPLNVYLSIGYYKHKPTQDTFRIVESYQNALRSGYYHMTQYVHVPITLGGEYRLLTDGKLSPTIGADVSFEIVRISGVSWGVDKTEYNQHSPWNLGAMPKLGVVYNPSGRWAFHVGVGKGVGLAGSVTPLSYTKAFIRITHAFSNKQ